MSVLTLPQARIPLGWVMVNGQRLPVEIDMEWMRAFLTLVARTGGVMGTNDFGLDVFGAVTTGVSADEVKALETVFQTAQATQSYPDIVQSPQVQSTYPDIVQPTVADAANTIALKAGTAGAPSLAFEGDLDTGIYSPGANSLAISANGAQQVLINPTIFELFSPLKTWGVTSTGATGTQKIVFDTSPTLVTPNLGTPSALVGTNITGTAAGLSVGYATTAGSAPTTGFSGTVSPVTSITVSNGLVTAAS